MNHYVRVYLTIGEDPRFKEVYRDDRALATWLRLLMLAEQTFPLPAPVPRKTSRMALRLLVAVGLVELEDHDHYRIHGLAKEREYRNRLGGHVRATTGRRDARGRLLPAQPTDQPADQPTPTPRRANRVHQPNPIVPVRAAPASTSWDQLRTRERSALSELGDSLDVLGVGSGEGDAGGFGDRLAANGLNPKIAQPDRPRPLAGPKAGQR